jgi:hypothetical protein
MAYLHKEAKGEAMQQLVQILLVKLQAREIELRNLQLSMLTDGTAE